MKLVKNLLEPLDGVSGVEVNQVSRTTVVNHIPAKTSPEVRHVFCEKPYELQSHKKTHASNRQVLVETLNRAKLGALL